MKNFEPYQSAARFAIFVFILSLLPLTACKRNPAVPPSPVVATVGGEPILLADLEKAMTEFSREVPLPSKGEELDRLKKDLLEQIIESRIFLQEAQRQNIQVSSEEMEDLVKKSKVDYKETEFDEMLNAQGLTYEQWFQRLKDHFLIQKLEEKATTGISEPDDEEIKRYYKSHLDDYRLKAGVKIRQILLATEKEANEVHRQLETGANFAKLATEKSLSPDKDLGGDLGVLTADQMPEGFEVTLTLPVGAISPVIQTAYGFHIFKVEGRQKERLSPLSEERSAIKDLLLQEKRDKQFARWALDLRNRTEIKIHSNFLKDSPA